MTIGVAEGFGLSGSFGQGKAASQSSAQSTVQGSLGPISGSLSAGTAGITGSLTASQGSNPGINQTTTHSATLSDQGLTTRPRRDSARPVSRRLDESQRDRLDQQQHDRRDRERPSVGHHDEHRSGGTRTGRTRRAVTQRRPASPESAARPGARRASPLEALLFTCVGVPSYRTKGGGSPREPVKVVTPTAGITEIERPR